MGIYRDAEIATENEIFKFANDLPQEEDDPNLSDDEIEELDLAEPEGWDGLPLGPEEVAYRNLYGDHEDGFDRPLQLAEEEQRQEAMLRSNQELIDRMAQQQTAFDEQRLQERKAGIIPNVLAEPERFVDHLEQQERQIAHANSAEGQQEAFVNHSMARAHQRHGDAFMQAYQGLISQDNRDPEIRALVKSIYDSDDPGSAVMEWAGFDGGGRGSRRERAGLRLPSLNSQSRASSHSRSPSGSSGSLSFRDLEKGGNGYSTSGSGDEEDVFNSVW